MRAATARSALEAFGGGEVEVTVEFHGVLSSAEVAAKGAPNDSDVIDELREFDEKENERDGAADD